MSPSETLSIFKKLRKAGNVMFRDTSKKRGVNSRSLAEKIRRLEEERDKLLEEVKVLKEMAKSKASALEREVTMLKEEEMILNELLRILDTTTDQIKMLSKRFKTEK